MNQVPKKVLFLITKATWGGAQKYVYDLATQLPREQFEVSVAYGVAGRLRTMLQERNVPTHALPSLGRDVALLSDVASFFQLVQLLRAERPDVLHVNSSKAAALGTLAGRLCGIRKIVFTGHGWPFKEGRNWLARSMIYHTSWFTALLSHATVVVSKADEVLGKQMRSVGEKIHYVPLAVELPVFLSRGEAWEKLCETLLGLREKPHTLRIATIGELTKNKGISTAIEAVAELSAEGGSAPGGKNSRGVDCIYVAFGGGEEKDTLLRLAQERGIASRIFFPGFTPNAAQYLKAFDVFLLPSIKEGMPYVLLEAATAGLPIVATTVVDSSFADNYPAVAFIPPSDTKALAEALTHIPSHSRTTATRFLEIRKMVQATSALY